MKNKNDILAIVRCNEDNIFDAETKKWVFGRNLDENSFALRLADAESILKDLNKERQANGYPEAYLVIV